MENQPVFVVSERFEPQEQGSDASLLLNSSLLSHHEDLAFGINHSLCELCAGAKPGVAKSESDGEEVV
jgi:hypothetical protein